MTMWIAMAVAGFVVALATTLVVLAAPRAPRPSVEVVGPYALERKLGEGGMGAVFEARHRMLGRRAALKLVRPAFRSADSTVRFDREARITSELVHPNIVSLYEYGCTREGTRYYAMELVEGITLSRLLRREGPLPSGRVWNILRQVAASLSHAHKKGFLHRDIKPENVMLCNTEGHPDCVKVLDFGLAKRFDADACNLSERGFRVGTPAFMAPELVDAPHSAGPAADVYAAGVLAYCLLTGSPPFDGDVAELALAHRALPPIAPSLRRPHDLPRDLEVLVLRCLEKDPTRRYADGSELLRALESCTRDGSWNEARAERWWCRANLESEPSGSAPPAPSHTTRIEPVEPQTEPLLLRRVVRRRRS